MHWLSGGQLRGWLGEYSNKPHNDKHDPCNDEHRGHNAENWNHQYPFHGFFHIRLVVHGGMVFGSNPRRQRSAQRPDTSQSKDHSPMPSKAAPQARTKRMGRSHKPIRANSTDGGLDAHS